ncbi:transmembrane protein 41B-like [Uloborus diversus]|uniref:transmembrane protein 41B-like n=1 Tax=Uloborus diversus TaxID=327109 RepID=UPI00240A061F|nr:transmembrane protein 41B-like [Uloborus diversus]
MSFERSNSINSVKEEDLSSSVSKRAPQSTKNAILLLVGIFLLSIASLFYLYTYFPDLEEDEVHFIKLPTDIEDAKNLGKILARYKERYYYTVLSAFFITYVFLQSFAIPGSIFLSILSGFLFPFPLAIFLVCTCSSLGATFCYVLSSQLGRKIVQRFFPVRAAAWAKQVHKHHSNLLNYIIFLRITPFLPNWFINITSPVIGVPALPFILGTFIGVAPPSFVYIQAGTTLHQLTSSTDAISLNSIFMLSSFAVLSLLPILFKGKIREKLE